jgi:hypothetical protein
MTLRPHSDSEPMRKVADTLNQDSPKSEAIVAIVVLPTAPLFLTSQEGQIRMIEIQPVEPSNYQTNLRLGFCLRCRRNLRCRRSLASAKASWIEYGGRRDEVGAKDTVAMASAVRSPFLKP